MMSISADKRKKITAETNSISIYTVKTSDKKSIVRNNDINASLTVKQSTSQAKTTIKLRAWCGECFQYFESNPLAKVSINHVLKGKCNLVGCTKTNNLIECVRKFANRNSENRHTYCINREMVDTWDECLMIQNVLNKHRKDSGEDLISIINNLTLDNQLGQVSNCLGNESINCGNSIKEIKRTKNTCNNCGCKGECSQNRRGESFDTLSVASIVNNTNSLRVKGEMKSSSYDRYTFISPNHNNNNNNNEHKKTIKNSSNCKIENKYNNTNEIVEADDEQSSVYNIKVIKEKEKDPDNKEEKKKKPDKIPEKNNSQKKIKFISEKKIKKSKERLSRKLYTNSQIENSNSKPNYDAYLEVKNKLNRINFDRVERLEKDIPSISGSMIANPSVEIKNPKMFEKDDTINSRISRDIRVNNFSNMNKKHYPQPIYNNVSNHVNVNYYKGDNLYSVTPNHNITYPVSNFTFNDQMLNGSTNNICSENLKNSNESNSSSLKFGMFMNNNDHLNSIANVKFSGVFESYNNSNINNFAIDNISNFKVEKGFKLEKKNSEQRNNSYLQLKRRNEEENRNTSGLVSSNINKIIKELGQLDPFKNGIPDVITEIKENCSTLYSKKDDLSRSDSINLREHCENNIQHKLSIGSNLLNSSFLDQFAIKTDLNSNYNLRNTPKESNFVILNKRNSKLSEDNSKDAINKDNILKSNIEINNFTTDKYNIVENIKTNFFYDSKQITNNESSIIVNKNNNNLISQDKVNNELNANNNKEVVDSVNLTDKIEVKDNIKNSNQASLLNTNTCKNNENNKLQYLKIKRTNEVNRSSCSSSAHSSFIKNKIIISEYKCLTNDKTLIQSSKKGIKEVDEKELHFNNTKSNISNFNSRVNSALEISGNTVSFEIYGARTPIESLTNSKFLKDSYSIKRFIIKDFNSLTNSKFPRNDLIKICKAFTRSGFYKIGSIKSYKEINGSWNFLNDCLKDSSSKYMGFIGELIKILELKNLNTISII